MKELTKLNTRGKNTALTIICDFAWSYSNYFGCYGELSFGISGGSHGEVVLHKEGAINKKGTGWGQSITNWMYIVKLMYIINGFVVTIYCYSIFFRIIELLISRIPSLHHIRVRFSSEKCPLLVSACCKKHICTSPKSQKKLSLKWAHIRTNYLQLSEHNFLRAEKWKSFGSLDIFTELGYTPDHGENNLQGTTNKLMRSNPPYHLLTDAGRGGFPIELFFLGVIWMLSGGIFKLSTMTLARWIRSSNANCSVLKAVTWAASLWCSGGASGRVGEWLKR